MIPRDLIPQILRKRNYLGARLTIYSLFFIILAYSTLSTITLEPWLSFIISVFGALGGALFSAMTVFWRFSRVKEAPLVPKDDYLESDFDEYVKRWLGGLRCCLEPFIVASSFTIYSFVFAGVVVDFFNKLGSTPNMVLYIGGGMAFVTFVIAIPSVMCADRELSNIDKEHELNEQFRELTTTFMRGKTREKDQMADALVRQLDGKDITIK